MLDIDPFLGDQIRVGGLGGLGGMPPPEQPKPEAPPMLPVLADDPKAALREGIAASARALGIDPVDLATAISYETAGTFDPLKRGPTTQWGRHRGLIQFGVPQAKQHGVDWSDPLNSQLGENGAVVSYLRSTGVKPGMGLLDIYSAINAGGVGRYNRTDANNGGAPGTVRDKVEQQMAGHRRKAEALFGGGSSEPRPAMAFTDAQPGGDVPPAFSRSLGQSQVPVSPMAGRIMASLENPGAGAMPDEPAMARAPRGVQVASLGNRTVPPVGPRPSAAPSPTPVQGQPNMPMEDYTQGPDRGALAFALMNAGMQPVGGGGEIVGGLPGGLGGMRMPQPSAAPVPGPSGAPQPQQSAIPQQGQPAPQQQPSVDDFLARAIPRVVPNPWALGGRALAENQAAEAQRQERILNARALIAKGVDPREAIAATANPQAMTQLMTQRRHEEQIALEREKFAYQQKNDQQTATLRDLAAENEARRLRGEKPLSPLEFKTQVAQAGRPSVTVDASQRAETAEAAKVGAAAGEAQAEMFKSVGAATTNLQRLNRLVPMMEQLATGRTLPGNVAISSWGRSLGLNEETLKSLGFDPQKAATAESVGSLLNQMVVGQIGAGAFPANNFSNTDREFLIDTMPKLSNDPRANALILSAMIRSEQSKIEKAQAFRDWRKENPKSSFNDFELSWAEKQAGVNRFADLQERADALLRGEQPAMPPGNRVNNGAQQPSQAPAPTVPDASTLPRIYTREQFDKLKPGDLFIDATGKNIRQKPGGQ